MTNKDHKARLAASIRAEQASISTSVESFAQRAAKAEAVLEDQQPPSAATTPALKPRPVSQANQKGQVEPVIRDSFTFPRADYALIEGIRQRCLTGGRAVTKSEVLRAGLQALHKMPATTLQQAIKGLAAVKTGRPKRA